MRYHDPIDPSAWRTAAEEEALPALLAELRRRVERSLLPGVKADLRMNLIYRMPSQWPHGYESMPPLMWLVESVHAPVFTLIDEPTSPSGERRS